MKKTTQKTHNATYGVEKFDKTAIDTPLIASVFYVEQHIKNTTDTLIVIKGILKYEMGYAEIQW